MHIPDGFLDLWIVGLCWLLAGCVLAVATRRTSGRADEERTALVGVVAAGIFATQMLNWPIPGGTSAHFVGGAFAGILLGPWLGVVAMTGVVTVQALVFGDGGLLALGANLLSLAVVDVLVGYALFRSLRGYHETGATFVAGWGAVTVSAATVGVAAGLSSAFAWELTTTVAVMTVGHAVLGFVEGAITAAVYATVVDARPDLLSGDGATPEVGA